MSKKVSASKVAPSSTADEDKSRAIDEKMKQLKAVGVTLADVKAYIDKRIKEEVESEIRSAETFISRRLSKGLELTVRENGNDATGAFSQRYDDCTRNMPPCWHTSIRDGTPIFRYKPADNLFIVIKPEVEEVKIHDGPALIDWLFTSGAYFKFYSFCLGLHFSLTFTLLLSPVVWIDVTDTEEILFNKTNVTSGIPEG